MRATACPKSVRLTTTLERRTPVVRSPPNVLTQLTAVHAVSQGQPCLQVDRDREEVTFKPEYGDCLLSFL